MSDTKNVGGPIMNEMWCDAIVASASPGLHFAMSSTRIGSTPGSSTPFNRPEMWASGAGMRMASSGVSWCAAAITRAL